MASFVISAFDAIFDAPQPIRIQIIFPLAAHGLHLDQNVRHVPELEMHYHPEGS